MEKIPLIAAQTKTTTFLKGALCKAANIFSSYIELYFIFNNKNSRTSLFGIPMILRLLTFISLHVFCPPSDDITVTLYLQNVAGVMAAVAKLLRVPVPVDYQLSQLTGSEHRSLALLAGVRVPLTQVQEDAVIGQLVFGFFLSQTV